MLSSTIVAALIAGGVSVTVSVIGFLVTKHKLKQDIALFTRQADVDLIRTLYDLRLDLYGKAFDITSRIYRRSESDWFQEGEVREWLKNLRDWKSGNVNLVISHGTLNARQESRTPVDLHHGSDREGLRATRCLPCILER